MHNMKSIINTLKKTINPPKGSIARTCSSIKKHQFPFNEKWLISNVQYKAGVKPNKENSRTKNYYGFSKTPFKIRYANHKKTFNNIKYQSDMELSNEC